MTPKQREMLAAIKAPGAVMTDDDIDPRGESPRGVGAVPCRVCVAVVCGSGVVRTARGAYGRAGCADGTVEGEMSETTKEEEQWDVLSEMFRKRGMRVFAKNVNQYECNWGWVHGGCRTAREDDKAAWEAARAAYMAWWDVADGRSRANSHAFVPEAE